jgi:hypothetical protein
MIPVGGIGWGALMALRVHGDYVHVQYCVALGWAYAPSAVE